MQYSVLFVCLANICRSPALEATLRHLAIQTNFPHPLHVDSCGVGWLHVGEHPDPRSFEAAKKRGIVMDHRSQQFCDSFFEAFDYIFAVDADIVEQLRFKARSQKEKDKVYLVTHFSKQYQGKELLDPYYFEQQQFDQMMDWIIDSCEGILGHLQKDSRR